MEDEAVLHRPDPLFAAEPELEEGIRIAELEGLEAPLGIAADWCGSRGTAVRCSIPRPVAILERYQVSMSKATLGGSLRAPGAAQDAGQVAHVALEPVGAVGRVAVALKNELSMPPGGRTRARSSARSTIKTSEAQSTVVMTSERFKELIESRGVETGAWRGEVRQEK